MSTALRIAIAHRNSSPIQQQQFIESSPSSPQVTSPSQTFYYANGSKVSNAQNIHVCRMKNGLEHTPNGKEKDAFKYYCPICMMYFKKIFKVECCSQYICKYCMEDILEHGKSSKSTNLSCPYCLKDHVRFKPVDKREQVRSYTDEVPKPSPSKGQNNTTSTTTFNTTTSTSATPSNVVEPSNPVTDATITQRCASPLSFKSNRIIPLRKTKSESQMVKFDDLFYIENEQPLERQLSFTSQDDSPKNVMDKFDTTFINVVPARQQRSAPSALNTRKHVKKQPLFDNNFKKENDVIREEPTPRNTQNKKKFRNPVKECCCFQ